MKIPNPFTRLQFANRKALRRALVLSLSLALFSVLAWVLRDRAEPALAALSDREQLAARARQLGPLAPIVLGLLLMLQVIIPMIPGQAIIITCGFLYGPVGGGLMAATSMFLSGQNAFAAASYAGRPLVQRMASPKALGHWERLASDQGILFYICIYTLPFMPGDLLVYVAGLGHLSTRRFAVANILGRLPLSVLIALLGAFQLKPPTGFWALPGLIVGLALAGVAYSLRALVLRGAGDLVHYSRRRLGLSKAVPSMQLDMADGAA